MSQPSFHLNIGEVVVPRSLPAVRSMATQTDESAVFEQAQADKTLYRRTVKWLEKWVLPVLRAAVTVLAFLLSRVGFGVRLN